MTAAQPPEAPSPPPPDGGVQPGPDRRRTVAILLAATVSVVVVGVIVAFGIIPLPDYPALAENPDPSIPGTVAFLSDEGTEDRRENSLCLYVVPASGGESRRLGCRFDELGGATIQWGGDLSFTPEGHVSVAVISVAGRSGRVVVETASGRVVSAEETEHGAFPDEPRPIKPGDPEVGRPDVTLREDGAQLVIVYDRPAVVLVQSGGARSDLLTSDGPRSYRFEEARWSPDGSFVLVRDSEGRLIVVRTDGTQPRLLARDVIAAAWFMPTEPGG